MRPTTRSQVKLHSKVHLNYLFVVAVLSAAALLIAPTSWGQANRSVNQASSQEEPLEPGEADFDPSLGDKGNEDSDPVGIGFGNVTARGSGCPAGTARATVSPDGKTISVLFDQFSSQSQGRQREISNCEMTIPVTVPAGFRMMVTRFDFRGFAQASVKARTVLKAQYQLLSSAGFRPLSQVIKRRKLFQGPFESSFTAGTRFRTGPKFTGCGESFVIRLNTILVAATKNPQASSLIQLDSADAAGNVQYHLRWKKCR